MFVKESNNVDSSEVQTLTTNEYGTAWLLSTAAAQLPDCTGTVPQGHHTGAAEPSTTVYRKK